MRNKCIRMYICIYLCRPMGRFLFVVNFFFGDSQHFLLSDNTGPKRLLQSPAPLALFPPLPRKTFATYINPTPNNILTRNIYPQLFATALLWTPPVLGPVFDNTVSRLFPHNKCESPTERKELSRKRLQRPFLHTVVSRGSHLAFAPSFSSIMVHVDIKKIRKTILSISYVACLNLNRNRRSWWYWQVLQREHGVDRCNS